MGCCRYPVSYFLFSFYKGVKTYRVEIDPVLLGVELASGQTRNALALRRRYPVIHPHPRARAAVHLIRRAHHTGYRRRRAHHLRPAQVRETRRMDAWRDTRCRRCGRLEPEGLRGVEPLVVQWREHDGRGLLRGGEHGCGLGTRGYCCCSESRV